jgi:hypothetical protein
MDAIIQGEHPSLRPVKPTECALAITIPLTRKQFLADIAQPSEKDFAQHYRKQRGLLKATAEYCWDVYADEEAIVAEAVCSEIERLGVTICYNAKLSDLTELFNRFPVVSLVAHSRFVSVKPEDIQHASALLIQLQKPKTEVQKTIRNAIEKLDPQLLENEITAQLSTVELRNRIAGSICKIADEAEKLYWDDESRQKFIAEEMPDGLMHRLTRYEFEQAFPDCIVSAHVIEFSDGMRTISELIEAVPNNFSGVLDLTVCSSVIQAAPIRHRKSNCLVVGNKGPKALKLGLYLYGSEISLLNKEPMPFIEAINRVRSSQFRDEAKIKKLWKLFRKFFNNILGRQQH